MINEKWWHAPVWGLRWACLPISFFTIINNAPTLAKPDTPIVWNCTCAGFFLLFSLVLSVILAQEEIVRVIKESKKGETK
jgi:hypothetical protein